MLTFITDSRPTHDTIRPDKIPPHLISQTDVLYVQRLSQYRTLYLSVKYCRLRQSRYLCRPVNSRLLQQPIALSQPQAVVKSGEGESAYIKPIVSGYSPFD